MTITDAALEAAAKLSKRYISDRFLPDKAIDLMDEAAARVRLGDTRTMEATAELERRATSCWRRSRRLSGSRILSGQRSFEPNV